MNDLGQLVRLHDAGLAQRVEHPLEEGVVQRLLEQGVRHLQVVGALEVDLQPSAQRMLNGMKLRLSELNEPGICASGRRRRSARRSTAS